MENIGRCGERIYDGIDNVLMDEVIKALKDSGADITGENPWEVDVNKAKIILVGQWDSKTELLTVIVKNKAKLAPCKKIWKSIDKLIDKIKSKNENLWMFDITED